MNEILPTLFCEAENKKKKMMMEKTHANDEKRNKEFKE